MLIEVGTQFFLELSVKSKVEEQRLAFRRQHGSHSLPPVPVSITIARQVTQLNTQLPHSRHPKPTSTAHLEPTTPIHHMLYRVSDAVVS